MIIQNNKITSLHELKAKVSKSNNTVMDFLYIRRISLRIAFFLLPTNIRPNHITILSFILYLSSAFMFAWGQHIYNLWGALLINLAVIFDCVDGDLARGKNLCSKFGHWMDIIFDHIAQALVFAGIYIGLYEYLLERNLSIIGILSVVNMSLIGILIIIKMKFPYLNKPSIKLNEGKLRIGFSEIIFLITICVFLNKLVVVLWVGACALPLVWIKSLLSIFKTHSDLQNKSE